MIPIHCAENPLPPPTHPRKPYVILPYCNFQSHNNRSAIVLGLKEKKNHLHPPPKKNICTFPCS